MMSPKGIADETPTGQGRLRGLWHSLHARLVVDRFVVQVRTKDDLSEDEPDGVWWLRVKWLPPVVGSKKSTRNQILASQLWTVKHVTDSSNFINLQQLLIEGRAEVAKREERERAKAMAVTRAAAKPKLGGPMLPIFGR